MVDIIWALTTSIVCEHLMGMIPWTMMILTWSHIDAWKVFTNVHLAMPTPPNVPVVVKLGVDENVVV